MRRPVKLEGSEQSVRCTGECGTQRCEGGSGPRSASGLCEYLTSALKLLASQQTRGDSFVDTIFQGFAGAEQDEHHE